LATWRRRSEEPRPGADRKLSGKEEALLVATACSNPPEGRARWTLELLADELVRLTEHDNVCRETVRRRLAENELKPWRKDMWCIPQVDGEFVARMEDVLDLYAAEPDRKRPVVCFDESPQLIGEVRQPIKAKPGQLERYDCEYSAMAPPTCSSSLTCIGPGARSKLPTAAPLSTSRPACGSSWTFTFPKRSASASCWIIH
jgi:hypothetical protein